MRTEPKRRDAVFILAPMPRCGTNFLWDLLRLHPEMAAGRSPIWEDYLLKNATHLERFATEAQASWDPVWGPTDHLKAPLLRHLGDALLDFMWIYPNQRLVTKSPTVENIELFFHLFPDSHLITLVRDGRDVTASGMRTFGWTLDGAARHWAKEIERLLEFHKTAPGERSRVVRYEDLVLDTRGTVKDIVSFLDLDVNTFDYDAIEDLPVRGSSRHLGRHRDAVHWDPVPRADGFTPTQRWREWDPAMQRQFYEIAGAQLELLGYDSL